ncbi:putative cytosolic glycoprotein FP21 [Babesia divergens]|uniref:Cytosolic glycoprotein FP21 n=1 Tax=Babesia divergens TaxID=32595 RepID=A0AAD9LKU0_BABDI|nr:putative cytosolic glycoprotein FP21 [Babesia divergens]
MLVQLVSGDGDVFTVDSKVLALSKLLSNMLKYVDEDSDLEPIVLNSISTRVLAKILDYCRYHEDKPAPPIPKPLKSSNLEDVVCSWDREFINVDTELLLEIMMAENFLDIKPLLELTCAKIASLVKGKTTDQIRDEFNIINDFTPEEEALIKEENKWCDEL